MTMNLINGRVLTLNSLASSGRRGRKSKPRCTRKLAASSILGSPRYAHCMSILGAAAYPRSWIRAERGPYSKKHQKFLAAIEVRLEDMQKEMEGAEIERIFGNAEGVASPDMPASECTSSLPTIGVSPMKSEASLPGYLQPVLSPTSQTAPSPVSQT